MSPSRLDMGLKERLRDDIKQAMRARDQARLDALRLLMAAIQRREVDERITLDDPQIVAVIEKQIKQGRDAVTQFIQGGRPDLADHENYQIAAFEAYLPEPLGDAEVEHIIAAAIAETGASSMKDMGKVMAVLKPKLLGRADMGTVSGKVKGKLTG